MTLQVSIWQMYKYTTTFTRLQSQSIELIRIAIIQCLNCLFLFLT